MAEQHPVLARLLSANAQWASDVNQAEPGFFAQTAQGQSPKVLWIGCSDSRVPESVVTASRPGDIFVHRNIANQFHAHDTSALSVLQYAVEHLYVEHVIVVGHSQCGGAAACLAASSAAIDSGELIPVPTHPPTDPINVWLKPLTALAVSLNLSNKPQAEALSILVNENVKAQVAIVAETEVIHKTWAEAKKKVWVHGWVFDIETGLLRDLGISKGPKV